MAKGRIVKALSGFYYVKTEDQRLYACKGRGVFRNKKITPLVGDLVTFDIISEDEGYIKEIAERKNELRRPPIVNIDKALIVSSITEPTFSPQLLDRFLVIVESKQIEAMIVFTKKDLASKEEMESIESYKERYEKLGYKVAYFSLEETVDDRLLDFLKHDITVIMGQTGVGKSTLLNTIEPSFQIKTGEISKSLGRGRHTTRHVELHQINGGLVADTPGFSSIDFEHIEANELGSYFVEIKEQAQYCRFRSCLHINEPHCQVKEALDKGEISQERYEHYQLFLQEILTRKPRY